MPKMLHRQVFLILWSDYKQAANKLIKLKLENAKNTMAIDK